MTTTIAAQMQYTMLRQTRLAQMFTCESNYNDGVYYEDFIKFVTTEAVNEGSRVNQRQCSACGYVLKKCTTKKCKKWVFAKFIQSNPSQQLQDAVAQLSRHKCSNIKDGTHCKLCKQTLTPYNRIEETTAKSYWTHSRNILYGALSTWNLITVDELIRKNSTAFIYRMQMLRGTFKNDKTSLSKIKENLIKPSLEKFFVWLRLRANFKPEEEDTSNEELQFYGTSRCGNPDCYQLGPFGCFEYVKTKDKDGNDDYVRQYKGDYFNFRCAKCEKEFPVCQFQRCFDTSRGHEKDLISKIMEESCICNYCMIAKRKDTMTKICKAAEMNSPKLGADSRNISIQSIRLPDDLILPSAAAALNTYSAHLDMINTKKRKQTFEADVTVGKRFEKKQKLIEYEKKKMIEDQIDSIDWSGVLPFAGKENALDKNINSNIARLEEMLQKLQRINTITCMDGVDSLMKKVCENRSELTKDEKKNAINLTKLCVKQILWKKSSREVRDDMSNIHVDLKCLNENYFAQVKKSGLNASLY